MQPVNLNHIINLTPQILRERRRENLEILIKSRYGTPLEAERSYETKMCYRGKAGRIAKPGAGPCTFSPSLPFEYLIRSLQINSMRRQIFKERGASNLKRSASRGGTMTRTK